MYQEKGDLNYQVENLVETLRYCRPRNGFLINKSNAEIADLLWDAVRETVGDLAAPNLDRAAGQMHQALNAFFVVDRLDQNLAIPLAKLAQRQSHVINFFVRPGRKPALTSVKE